MAGGKTNNKQIISTRLGDELWRSLGYKRAILSGLMALSEWYSLHSDQLGDIEKYDVGWVSSYPSRLWFRNTHTRFGYFKLYHFKLELVLLQL